MKNENFLKGKIIGKKNQRNKGKNKERKSYSIMIVNKKLFYYECKY